MCSSDLVDTRSPSLYAQPKAMKLLALGRIKASVGEVRANPRARSATLRVAERTAAHFAASGAAA